MINTPTVMKMIALSTHDSGFISHVIENMEIVRDCSLNPPACCNEMNFNHHSFDLTQPNFQNSHIGISHPYSFSNSDGGCRDIPQITS